MHRARETGCPPSANPKRRGATMVVVVVALVALIAAASLGVDVGLVMAARTQLQNATDAAALAAAANLIDPEGPSVTADLATRRAQSTAAANVAVPEAGVNLESTDIVIGRWDLATRTFEDAVDISDPDQVNAVQVTARLDGAANGPVPAFMARVLGRQSFRVSTDAIAWLGFAGGGAPGEVDLPVAVDCCRLRGPDCEADFCTTIETNPPNECLLADGNPGVKGTGGRQDVDEPAHPDYAPVSCLEFHDTGEQNVCWTNFSEDDHSVDAPELQSLSDTGNIEEVSQGDLVYVDNGDKVPVIDVIHERFLREGQDRYPPFLDQPDSWVVRLPVISCQMDGNHCSRSSRAEIKGFVCFEIREIEVNPAKEIRGRFLCKDSGFVKTYDLFENCDIDGSPSGGDDYNIRSKVPVLVE